MLEWFLTFTDTEVDMLYNSTRNKNLKLTASLAILKGLSDDGGLFVPQEIPEFDKSLDELKGLDYRELAYEIMKLYFDDFTEEELKSCIASAYDDKFDTEEIAPLTYAGNVYYLELFHGKTIAFKDMALSILPHLMTVSAKKNDIKEEIVILTATSGDTGKAALAGFADVPGTRIMVFYPKDGVSPVQKLQMVTQTGDNTCVVGVNGNFDDCQSAVKAIFNDAPFASQIREKGFVFSSANSINIGRLIPQIVYYVYAYCRLLSDGRINEHDRINICVPTGNFGNILAAYYAKRMGLPVNRLICASNENKVLFDFLKTGVYDKNRPFILTCSPSMDILISSNLERLIYHLAGDDDEKCAALMKELANGGRYEIDDAMKEGLSDFLEGFATQEQTFSQIRKLYEDTGYVIDPHTAVASFVYSSLKDTLTGEETVVASTASPFKFAKSVMSAIRPDLSGKDDLDLIDELASVSNTEVPAAIKEIKNAPVRHKTETEKEEIKKAVTGFLS
ncbi:MAG: threonine synthase [Lachnospiraceae bacterium]|nr:threonine synthase [Lachnospiraceae bacterium]